MSHPSSALAAIVLGGEPPRNRVRPPAIERRLSVARRSANSMSMKPRDAATLAPKKCERCGDPGKQRQLDKLLQHNKSAPIIVLCDECVHSLKYADARTWRWFREYRDRLISSQDK